MPSPFVTIAAATTAADYSMSLPCRAPLQGPDETRQPWESFTFPSQFAVHSAFNLSEYTRFVLPPDDATVLSNNLAHTHARARAVRMGF